MHGIKSHSLKYKNLHKFFVSNKGYISPFSPFICDKSLDPFLLGLRGDYYYYDLIKSFPYMKIGLNILENSIAAEAKILLCERTDPLFFFKKAVLNDVLKKKCNAINLKEKNPVICMDDTNDLFLPKNLNLILLNYRFSSIPKLNVKNIGIILIHNIGLASMGEVESKTTPIIGVGCLTLKGVNYPFNASVENLELSKWYFFIILNVFRRGLYRRKKKKNEV